MPIQCSLLRLWKQFLEANNIYHFTAYCTEKCYMPKWLATWSTEPWEGDWIRWIKRGHYTKGIGAEEIPLNVMWAFNNGYYIDHWIHFTY